MSRPGQVFAILIFVTSLSGSLHAQMMPFHGSTAMAIGFENRALRSFVKRTELSGLERDGRSIPDPLNRKMSVTALPIVVPYAVHRTIIPIVMFPIIHKSLSMETPDGPSAINNRGFGDVTVLIKYVPLQWDGLNETKRIAFFGGVKFPTGSSEKIDRNGQTLPASLQLGTGAYEVPLGISYSMQTPRMIGFVADFFYRVNTEGKASTGADSFSYDLALGATIYPSKYRTFEEKTVNLYLELNGRHEMDSGDTLFLSPGVQFILLKNLAAEFSIQAPIYEKYNTARLATDFTVSTGFRWLLPF